MLKTSTSAAAGHIGLYREIGCVKLGKYATASVSVFEVNVMYAPNMSPYAQEPRSAFRNRSPFASIFIGEPLFVTNVNECGSNCLNVCGLSIPVNHIMVASLERISFFDYALIKVIELR